MLYHNRKFLYYISFIFVLLYVIIVIYLYFVLKNLSNDKIEDSLHNILLYEQAQKRYVDECQKKFIFTLQDKHILSKDFFSPVLMSATFITRNTFKKYNELRKKHNLPPIVYRVASDNPRNPINKATSEELKLLERFNERDITKYKKYITIDNEDYLYYALPVVPNNDICMRCHGVAKDAPKDLVKLYGDKAGFGEKKGHIRAFFALTFPLKSQQQFIEKINLIFDVILFILFCIAYYVIYKIILKLDIKDKKLLENMHKDGLTKVYNRKKFHKDMKNVTYKENEYLMLLDIDYFKKVNDTYGHPVGDYVLETLAKLIQDNIRDRDKFYRIGGEEFAIISIQKNKDDEIKFAQRIRKIIEDYNFEKAGKVTISIGFTALKDNETYEEWYKRADEALYEAKKERNKVVEK